MKHSGDTIDAKFSNIVVKYGIYRTVTISGTISPDRLGGSDWDSAPSSCSWRYKYDRNFYPAITNSKNWTKKLENICGKDKFKQNFTYNKSLPAWKGIE